MTASPPAMVQMSPLSRPEKQRAQTSHRNLWLALRPNLTIAISHRAVIVAACVHHVLCIVCTWAHVYVSALTSVCICAYMHVYMYTCVYVPVCMYTFACMHTHLYACVPVCMCACVHVYMCMYACVPVCVYTCACLHVCTCACAHLCVCSPLLQWFSTSLSCDPEVQFLML